MRASKLPNKKSLFDFAPEPATTESFLLVKTNYLMNLFIAYKKARNDIISPVLWSKTSWRLSPSILDRLFPQVMAMFFEILASTTMWLDTITHTNNAIEKDWNFAISVPISGKLLFWDWNGTIWNFKLMLALYSLPFFVHCKTLGFLIINSQKSELQIYIYMNYSFANLRIESWKGPLRWHHRIWYFFLFFLWMYSNNVRACFDGLLFVNYNLFVQMV